MATAFFMFAEHDFPASRPRQTGQRAAGRLIRMQQIRAMPLA